ncbi:MAG: hypothetical protein LBQ23_03060 [Puniceicoccales bacterium]|jgi:signal peptidase I|nr:hypothetical protein [Puniceicoccales bacterium]
MSHRRILESSKALVASARKVTKYREHLLAVDILANINLRTTLLESAIEAKDFTSLETQSKDLGKLLKQYGGDIAPETFLGENTEVLFVAILLAISIRTFFIQSFQIPTNSIAPTYYGMPCKLANPEAMVANV